MAVRRAIFILPGHAEEVKVAISKENFKRILVLGTSDNMALKICRILDLPKPSKIIHIQDIASQEEIQKAHDCRIKEGKHIIPVPTIELKPHFSGYLIDPIQTFFQKKRRKKPRKLGEKSIVRPIFSYYGRLVIDDSAILSIVNEVVRSTSNIPKLFSIHVSHICKNEEDCGLAISFSVVVQYGQHIPSLINSLQKKVKDTIEYMTGMLVQNVDITVKALQVSI